jgi:hypothetical protein
MKHARINKQDGQQDIELFFVQKESTDNAAPKQAKNKKKTMRSFILVKFEQLILCDCELLARLEVYVAPKIRWQ